MPRRTLFSLATMVFLLSPGAARATCTEPLLFDPPQNLVTGPNPLFMVVADFDEDGLLDLAVTNGDHLAGGGASSLALLRGTGSGTFATAVLYPLPSGAVPHGLVAADFDEDGILDLAVANKFSNTISILRGLGAGGVGNGTFGIGVQIPAGGRPFQILAADFNADGILDLATSINSSPGAVNVLFGQGTGGIGDGSFSPPVVHLLANQSTGLDAGDFNGDGILDLVATENYSGTVGVMLGGGSGGVGDGTFRPAVHVPAGPEPFDLAIADFDDDGHADLAVANAVSGGTGGTAVLRGIGDGTFGAPLVLPSGHTTGVIVMDANDDAIDDLIAAVIPGTDDGTIEVYLGRGASGVGDGTFQHVATHSIGSSPYQLVAADVTADGRADLVASATYHDYVAVLPGACAPLPPDLRAPVLTDVRDVPNDQGGRVFVTWTASSLDVTGGAVIEYRVWRRIPAALALRPRSASEAAPVVRVRRGTRPDGSTEVTYWEALVTLPAQRLAGYGYTAATTQDSMRAGNPYSAYFVSALTSNIDVFYSSNVDSGYSVDNLKPHRPAAFAGELVAGPGYRLEWQANDEPDVAAYQIYRSPASVPDFSGAVRIATISGTTYTDESSTGNAYYWLVAVDAHENQSDPAMLVPSSPTPVGPQTPILALRGAAPNPSTMGTLAIAFTLPDARPARLELLDVAGRVVSSGVFHAAGAHSITMGAGRRLSPGVYLVRLRHGAQTLESKAIVTR